MDNICRIWGKQSKAYNPDWPIWSDGGAYGDYAWDMNSHGYHGKC